MWFSHFLLYANFAFLAPRGRSLKAKVRPSQELKGPLPPDRGGWNWGQRGAWGGGGDAGVAAPTTKPRAQSWNWRRPYRAVLMPEPSFGLQSPGTDLSSRVRYPGRVERVRAKRPKQPPTQTRLEAWAAVDEQTAARARARANGGGGSVLGGRRGNQNRGTRGRRARAKEGGWRGGGDGG